MEQKEGILEWQLRTMMIRESQQRKGPTVHAVDESEFDFGL